MKPIAYSLFGVLMLCVGLIAEQRPGGEGDKATLKAMNEKWDIVAVKGDVTAMGAMFDDIYIETDSQGKVQNKAEMLAQLRSGDLKYLASKTDDITVYLHGNAAVVNGRWAGRFVLKGKTANGLMRYTSTFVFKNGQWLCVALQTSNISKRPI
jgi:hypothetical protein